MKKGLLIIGLLGVAVTLFVCQRSDHNKSTEKALPVQVATVQKAKVAQPIRTSGRLSSSSEIKLSFKIGGIIDAISVREGQSVQKGQFLASLKLDEIEGQVAQARAGFEKAERDFKRVQNLYADSAVTLEQLQNVKSGLIVAESNLKIAEFNLSHAQIRAPSQGRILKQLSEAGELVGSGQPVLFFGSHSGRWIIKAGVSDQDLIRIALDDSASVGFDAYPGMHFPASVKEIAAGPDPQNGLYTIQLELYPMSVTLFSGFMAKVDIFSSQTEMVYQVPFAALVNVRGSHGYVYRVEKDSLAKKVPVEIAYYINENAMIRKGLEGVDFVITEGAAYLDGKTKVRIVDRM